MATSKCRSCDIVIIKVANKFIMPNTADISMVKRVQVKVILPDPIGTGTTHRTKSGIVFNVAFGNLKLY